LKKDICMEHL